MAEIKRLNLGHLNSIYERELNKLDVHQVIGRSNVSRDGEGGKSLLQNFVLDCSTDRLSDDDDVYYSLCLFSCTSLPPPPPNTGHADGGDALAALLT